MAILLWLNPAEGQDASYSPEGAFRRKYNIRGMRSKPITKEEPARETLLEGSASVFGVLAVGLFALTFIFQNFLIPSLSMASTLRRWGFQQIRQDEAIDPSVV
jgi:hypothetical protein